MFKFKSKMIIAVILIMGVTAFVGCEKVENNKINSKKELNKQLNNPTTNWNPEYIGELHNYLYDSLAYNWCNLNNGNTPLDNTIDYLLNVCANSYDLNTDDEVKDSLKNTFKSNIQNWLSARGTTNLSFYEYYKPTFKELIGDGYLPHFFSIIDSLIYETNMNYNNTKIAIVQLNTYVINSNITSESTNCYLAFTSVMMHSLQKYYEIEKNVNHPFHKYLITKASVGSWVVSDAIGAGGGVLEGGGAGAAGGPVGVFVGAVLGGVLEGAMASAVETSVSDLIDQWWNSL